MDEIFYNGEEFIYGNVSYAPGPPEESIYCICNNSECQKSHPALENDPRFNKLAVKRSRVEKDIPLLSSLTKERLLKERIAHLEKELKKKRLAGQNQEVHKSKRKRPSRWDVPKEDEYIPKCKIACSIPLTQNSTIQKLKPILPIPLKITQPTPSTSQENPKQSNENISNVLFGYIPPRVLSPIHSLNNSPNNSPINSPIYSPINSPICSLSIYSPIHSTSSQSEKKRKKNSDSSSSDSNSSSSQSAKKRKKNSDSSSSDSNSSSSDSSPSDSDSNSSSSDSNSSSSDSNSSSSSSSEDDSDKENNDPHGQKEKMIFFTYLIYKY
ncbi:nucleolin 1-like [Leptopilina heterotoma]|uniref:nucleolin 1-like n=1 Tax=Leptopilina heterotoma TaxID=63436 RepID=UPI001CA9893B|nr:nucleolin 1-like [Leptopilina heterotoma]